LTENANMRRLLLTKLISWKDKLDRKPLLLQGARQVGKTTLLHQFGKQSFRAYHMLNFEKEPALAKLFEESLDPNHLITEIEFYLKTTINRDTDLLVFDEIQACSRALTSLKYFAEDCPKLALAAAGSLLGIYLGPVSFPVGKVDIITLYPMSIEEFLLALDETQILDYLQEYTLTNPFSEVAHKRLFENLLFYFIVGGLPEVVKTFRDSRESLFTAFENVREKQNTLITTYLGDIAKHSGKVNAMHIARVWQAIPSQLSANHDVSAPKFTFKGVVPGIDRYSRLANAIDWLEAARLILKVPVVNAGHLPFAAHASENAFKLFLFDVGLLGAMAKIPPEVILKYDYGSYKGYFAENYVAQALSTAGLDLYSWQEKKAEVEFVMQQDGKAIPIEVKSGFITKSQSAKLFAAKYNSPHQIILSARNFSQTPSVKYFPLYWAGKLVL
jgi:uncharacterized protein